MKILIIANEFPYPPDHGGKADIWNRIIAFHAKGAEIFLLTWVGIVKGIEPTTEQINHVKKTVSALTLLPLNRGVKRLTKLHKYPSLAAARLIDDARYAEIKTSVAHFNPEFIFVDDIFPGVLGLKLAADLKLPVAVRLHNIQHTYMRGQLAKAKGLKAKLSLYAAILHLKKFEYDLISKVDHFFDCSMDDCNFWKSQGFPYGDWLPGIVNNAPDFSNVTEDNTGRNYKWDICFLGNLNAPNNVAGVIWFLEQVLPAITAAMPNVQVLIMGSAPTQALTDICATHNGVTLIASPPDPDIYLTQSNILINPVQFGSGINQKAIHMLFKENQVVSTSVGVMGLPAEMKEVFFVADTPDDFANTVVDILQGKAKKSLKDRIRVQNFFRPDIIKNVMNIMTNKRA